MLNFNPFLLEFFALARGYGLGAGCMMMSMSLFFLWIKNQKTSWIIISFFMAALAVLSNFIYLNYLASLIAVYILYFGFDFYLFSRQAFQNKKQPLDFKLLAIPTLTSIILFIPLFLFCFLRSVSPLCRL